MTNRGVFLECGAGSLHFNFFSDDLEWLYGDIPYFLLFYYLSDDTVEIMRTNAKNSSKSFPKLLKRSRLPKNRWVSDGSNCYTWRDLVIGHMVKVFGRTMLIARSTTFTRQY